MFAVKWSKDVYFLIIFVYIVLASTLPVNLLLQPRDYLSSFFLYFGLLVGGIAALISFKPLDAIPIFTSFSAKLIGGQPSPLLADRPAHHRLRRPLRLPLPGGLRHQLQAARQGN